MEKARKIVRINLAKPTEKPEKERKLKVSLGVGKEEVTKYLPIILGIVIGLVITFTINLYLEVRLRAKEDEYRSRQEEMLRAVGSLRMYSEVARKVEEVGRKKRILEELSKPLEMLDVINGDLKRLVIPGLWLKDFSVDFDKKEMVITGRALREDLISEYLRRVTTLSWLKDVSLREVKSVTERDGKELKEFNMVVGLR